MILADDIPHSASPLFDSNNMVNNDGLPSYDMATSQVSSPGPYVLEGSNKAQDVKVPPEPQSQPTRDPSGPSQAPRLPPSLPQPTPYTGQPTTVYNYVNPNTGEHVTSLLPPDHPQMICLQEGKHVPHTRFGLLGVLAAIFWFPLGIACCLLDQKTRCSRCGMVLDEGLCG